MAISLQHLIEDIIPWEKGSSLRIHVVLLDDKNRFEFYCTVLLWGRKDNLTVSGDVRLSYRIPPYLISSLWGT